jgi:hypothetical protein
MLVGEGKQAKVTNVRSLKDNLPKGKMDEKETKAYADHLVEAVTESYADDISKGVSGSFDEYYPDKEDFQSFLKEEGDAKVPAFYHAEGNTKLIGAIPGMEAAKYADGVMEFMRFMKNPIKTGINFASAIKNGFKNWAKDKIKDQGWAKMLDKMGIIDVKSKDDVDFFPSMHKNWQSVKSLANDISASPKAMKDRGFLDDKVIEEAKQYSDMVVSHLFSEDLEKNPKRLERKVERQAEKALKSKQKEIGGHIKRVVSDLLAGKEVKPEEGESKSGLQVTGDNLSAAIKAQIDKVVPKIKEDLDHVFSGNEEARKSIQKKVDGVDAAGVVKRSLIPKVTGGLEPKVQTKSKSSFLGVPTRSLPDVKGILEGKYEGKSFGKGTPKKEEPKEKADTGGGKGRKEFIDQQGDKLVPNPNPKGRKDKVKVKSLSGMVGKGVEMFKSMYQKWKGKTASAQDRSLVSGLIRVAYNNEEIRPVLLPVIKGILSASDPD